MSNHLIKIIELKNDNEYKKNWEFSSVKSYVNVERTTQYARRKQSIKFDDLNDVNLVVINDDVWMNVNEIWDKINILFENNINHLSFIFHASIENHHLEIVF